ncbi:unnamed protein product, partial [Diamesa hyperborea]
MNKLGYFLFSTIVLCLLNGVLPKAKSSEISADDYQPTAAHQDELPNSDESNTESDQFPPPVQEIKNLKYVYYKTNSDPNRIRTKMIVHPMVIILLTAWFHYVNAQDAEEEAAAAVAGA